MADAEARQLIEQLQAAGWTGAGIARAIDRDPAMVNQTARDARGSGYGRRMVPALRQLAAGAPTAAVERRTGAEGRPARVRRPVIDTPAGRLVSATSPGGAVVREQLERAAREGRRVHADIRQRDGGRATAWRKGGWDARRLLSMFDNLPRAIAEAEGVAYLDPDEPIVSVDLHIEEGAA